jgi:ABC-2 type transport system permease protein
MEHKTEKLFSKALYFQTLKNLKNAAIAGAVCFIILNMLIVLAIIEGRPGWEPPEPIGSGEILPLAIMIIPIAFFLVQQAFSFLDKRKSSDFYHSIPQKRICVYSTIVLSVITYLCLIILGAVLVNTLIFATSDYYYISFSTILFALSGTTLATLCMAGTALLCKMLSGNAITYWFYSVLSFLIPKIMVYFFLNLLSDINYSIVISDIKIDFITAENTPLFLFFVPNDNGLLNAESLFEIFKTSATALIEAFLLIGISAILYCKRKSQLAEKRIAYKGAHVFFSILVCTPLLFLAYLYFQTFSIHRFDGSIIILISLSFLIHFLFELIISKSLKKAFKALPRFLITLLVTSGIIASAFAVGNIYVLSNPTADEIQSIYLTSHKESIDVFDYGYYDYTTTYPSEQYFNLPTTSPDAFKAVVEDLKTSINRNRGLKYTKHRYTVNMTLKNGKKVSRSVMFSEESFFTVVKNIMIENKDNERIILPPWEEIDSKITYYSISEPEAYLEPPEITFDAYLVLKNEYDNLPLESRIKITLRQENSKGHLYFLTNNVYYDFYLSETDFPKTLALIEKLSKQNEEQKN